MYKISRMRAVDVRWWHRKYEETPTTANRALAVLSRMFRYAQENSLVAPGHNPCSFVKSFPERKRKRFATKDELTKILSRLIEDLDKKPKPAGFLLCLLYCGARPHFLLNAKWRHLREFEKDGKTFGIIDMDGKTTSVTGETETVILPPKALEIVKRQSKYRLDGRIFGGPLPHSYWKKLVKEVGCEDLWLRDLRRTFATIGKSSGETMDVIGDLLNHKSQQTTKIYAKLMDEKRFDAVMNISNGIDSFISPALDECLS